MEGAGWAPSWSPLDQGDGEAAGRVAAGCSAGPKPLGLWQDVSESISSLAHNERNILGPAFICLFVCLK